MKDIKAGGCQCGKIRFEVNGNPIKVYACHCTICQKQSGSAFGMAAVFAEQFFKITKGKPNNFVRDGTDKKVRNYFCAHCGTRLFHQWFTNTEISSAINIKPGTLDETSWLRPGCHVWTQHAQPWFCFGEKDILFKKQPDDLNEMPNFTE